MHVKDGSAGFAVHGVAKVNSNVDFVRCLVLGKTRVAIDAHQRAANPFIAGDQKLRKSLQVRPECTNELLLLLYRTQLIFAN